MFLRKRSLSEVMNRRVKCNTREIDIMIFQTQQLESTNGIVRQQTGRWHRRQNKFALILGTDRSDSAVSGELFQLDLSSSSPENYCCHEREISARCLVLGGVNQLYHTSLMHHLISGSFRSFYLFFL